MKLKVVAVRDTAISAFGQPVFTPNIGGAIRSFGDEIKRPHSVERPNALNQHPEDYDLFYLGEYNDEDGTFETRLPEVIAKGANYV